MDAGWEASHATIADVESIASLFVLSWTSPFSRMMFGAVQAATLTADMAPRIAQQMQNKCVSFTVVREPGTRRVVSVAQWTLPTDEAEEKTSETREDREERQAFEDTVYEMNLPEKSNKGLIMEFTVGLRDLRRRVLKGERHYLLDNIATHPDYRGQGLASRLIEWTFSQADEGNVLVYLDTASDNPAWKLYRRLGFEERGHFTIEDLSRFVTKEELDSEYHGARKQVHTAFVRYPR